MLPLNDVGGTAIRSQANNEIRTVNDLTLGNVELLSKRLQQV